MCIFSYLVQPKKTLALVSKSFLKASVVTNVMSSIPRSEICCQFIQSIDLSFSKIRPEIGNFPNLRNLVLAGCHWVDDEFLLEISSSKISNLNLYWCVHVTDRGVCSLISGNPEISSLVISGCSKLTDVTMQAIADKIPNLRILDVTRCPLVTDVGLSEIADSRRISDSLENLNLYAKTQNVDVSFYGKIGNFRNLKFLDLCGHLKLTDVMMSSLVLKLDKLETLNLSWCVEIGDITVNCLCKRRISSLSLFGIKRISASAIEEFLKYRGDTLVALDIRGIPSVRYLTVDDCKELRQRVKQLVTWKIHT